MVMNNEIISAVLALVGTLFGTFGGIIASSKLTSFRLEQLEKKMEKHNNYIERTFKLEERAELHEEKLKVINHRLDDLSKGRKGNTQQ